MVEPGSVELGLEFGITPCLKMKKEEPRKLIYVFGPSTQETLRVKKLSGESGPFVVLEPCTIYDICFQKKNTQWFENLE